MQCFLSLQQKLELEMSNQEEKILLSHGSGGKLSHKLISNLFIKHFDNDILTRQTDSAILDIENKSIAFTTDSFVVHPIHFPGGNIGKLAICGTVNDLAVSGAKPLYLSTSFIIEEGFSIRELEKIVKSMAEEAKRAEIKIVTGDTKVVNKGKCDKIFINTTGIGVLEERFKHISLGTNIKVGDKIIINGTLGDHGMAILAAREELKIKSKIKTDCASLNKLIREVLKIAPNVKFMRDPTRGGMATVLCELVENKNFAINIDESTIPIKEEVKGICEIFGFDPLYVANEGKVIMVVDKEDSEGILSTMRKNEYGQECRVIGEVVDTHPGKVILNTEIGGSRIVDMMVGEMLPRIC